MFVVEAKAKLDAFVTRKNRKTLERVCVEGEYAYATDGRIAFKVKLCEDGGVDITENFPINAVKKFCEEQDAVSRWYDASELKELAEVFQAEYKIQREHEMSDMRGRYKEVVCPDCGRYVYWDTYNEVLVSNMEEGEPFEPRDMDWPIKLGFPMSGDSGIILLVNFGYLYTAMKVFGDDILIAPENKKDNPKLFIRTRDGGVKGVLMPLHCRGELQEDDYKKAVVFTECKEVENV